MPSVVGFHVMEINITKTGQLVPTGKDGPHHYKVGVANQDRMHACMNFSLCLHRYISLMLILSLRRPKRVEHRSHLTIKKAELQRKVTIKRVGLQTIKVRPQRQSHLMIEQLLARKINCLKA